MRNIKDYGYKTVSLRPTAYEKLERLCNTYGTPKPLAVEKALDYVIETNAWPDKVFNTMKGEK